MAGRKCNIFKILVEMVFRELQLPLFFLLHMHVYFKNLIIITLIVGNTCFNC